MNQRGPVNVTGRATTAAQEGTLMSLHETAVELSATAYDLASAVDTDSPSAALADRVFDLAAVLAAAIGSARPDHVDLAAVGRVLSAALRANWREAITDANQLDVQALCVAEEAGEFIGAYRRWAGKARRTGTFRELEDETADVVITTAVFAHRAGIDLNAAIGRKLAVVYSRGWRDDSIPECTP